MPVAELSPSAMFTGRHHSAAPLRGRAERDCERRGRALGRSA
jgi:hypothetical protein